MSGIGTLRVNIPPFRVRGIFCFQFNINIVLISSKLVCESNSPFRRPLFYIKLFYPLIKWKPNSQGILNWIIQTLHYYYRKQHKNIENSQIIEQNLVISLPFSLFSTACASFALLAAEFFQFFKRHNGFLQVKPS